jgi:hypothetical protein
MQSAVIDERLQPFDDIAGGGHSGRQIAIIGAVAIVAGAGVWLFRGPPTGCRSHDASELPEGRAP